MRYIVQPMPLPRLQLHDVQRKARVLDVITKRSCKAAEKSPCPGRPKHSQRLCARFRLPVFRCKNKGGHITNVVRVEVCNAEVRNLRPGQIEAGEVMNDPGTTIEQDPAGTDAHEIRGAYALRVRYCRARPNDGNLHVSL